MANAYHYQNSFDDALAVEFKGILSQGFDPRQITNLQLWLDANDANSITKDGSNKVSQWLDKSGKGNHATQGTVISQPLHGAMQQNNRNVISFDGIDDALSVANFPLTDCHVFCVSKQNIAATQMPFNFYNGTATDGWGLAYSGSNGGSVRVFDDINNADVSTRYLAAISSGWHVLELAMVSKFNGMWIDGEASANNELSSDNLASFAWEFAIGARRSTSPLLVLNGDVAEIIIYNRLLPAAQRQQVENYLALKWGVI